MAIRTRRSKMGAGSKIAAYLRSIDVGLDANSPERFAHFMPTQKSARLLRTLVEDIAERTFMVVAPYGSGKSLAASYALHLTENRSASSGALMEVEKRLDDVDPALAKFASERRKDRNRRGLVLPLSGPQEKLHVAIRNAALEAFGRQGDRRRAGVLNRLNVDRPEDVFLFLDELQAKSVELGFDRILIVWDEFGKHLEFLVQEGRTSDLFHVQKLAEYATRAKLPIILGLFLHMGFLHYAGVLSQAARTEWKKVEGRFETIDFVDDSEQLYELIGRLVFYKRKVRTAPENAVAYWSGFCRQHGLFKELPDNRLEALLRSAYPFTPPAVFVLPRLASRISQNERTIFHFIENWDGSSEVKPAELYDYFSSQMRSDSSTGGTHRQWLEANSAIQKVTGEPNLEAVIKTACLFGLGLYGRSGCASHEFLSRAWMGFEAESGSGMGPVDQLIKKKLLLYRPYKDEVMVWHGSDLDIRGQLELEKSQRGSGFDVVTFLNEYSPAQAWRPLSYNTEYSIRRYFSSSFHTVNEFRDLIATEGMRKYWEGDGHIAILLPETVSERDQGRALADSNACDGLVVAYPAEPLPLANAALEVFCLYKMQEDQDLIATDPLVLEEIRQLTGDAEAHLQSLIKRVTIPTRDGPYWAYGGVAKQIAGKPEVREFLSEICRSLFSQTPKLNNELINKKKPSAVVVNSRKKLVLGILERTGSKDLGLPLTTPDGSMFRTLIVNTGLYLKTGEDSWSFAASKGTSIKDPALRAIWSIIADFVGSPEKEPKPLTILQDVLLSPPIGLREGVYPIFLAAGIRAFGGMTAIRKSGRIVEDLLPSTIEDMANCPNEYTFEPVSISRSVLGLIQDFINTFSNEITDPGSQNILMVAGDLLREWRAGLPYCASRNEQPDEGAEKFRQAVFGANDVVSFFVETLPNLVEEHGLRNTKRKALLQAWKACLEMADQIYYQKIEMALRTSFGLPPDRDLSEAAQERSRLFPNEFINQIPDPLAVQLLLRMRRQYKEPKVLCRSVAQLLTEKRIKEFDDQVMASLKAKLNVITEEIDRSAAWVEGSLFGGELRAWVIENRHARIRDLFNDLRRLAGDGHAENYLLGLMGRMEKRAR